MNSKRAILLIAIVISLATLITWRATGGDYFTKFQIVERIKVPVDPDDPLAQAGFYEDSLMTQTVSKSEFRLGLLPTPSRLFDKNIISVVSILVPVWTLAIFLIWLERKKHRLAANSNSEKASVNSRMNHP